MMSPPHSSTLVMLGDFRVAISQSTLTCAQKERHGAILVSGIRRRPKNISPFDARAHTAIQLKQLKQVKQVKQVKQTSLEMH